MQIKDKDAVAELLRKEGYHSENIDGVVITKFQLGLPTEYYTKSAKRIREIFESIGYNASNAIHIVKDLGGTI